MNMISLCEDSVVVLDDESVFEQGFAFFIYQYLYE